MRLVIFYAAVFLSTASNAADLVDHSSSKITLHFAGAGPHTLEVRTINGVITIEAYDGPNVQMVVDKTIVADDQDGIAAAKREVVLETRDGASTVGAVAKYPHQGACGDEYGGSDHDWRPKYVVRYDFTIRVPRATGLALCTINEGDVQVSGTRGDFYIRSVNGRITMRDVAGAGNATTVNGPVTASFVEAPQSASIFTTINGGVAVTMPEGLSADLRMKTFNGGLFTDFEVQPQTMRTDVITEKQGSMHVYRFSGYTTVRAGKGGPELTLESLNGDVRLMRRSR